MPRAWTTPQDNPLFRGWAKRNRSLRTAKDQSTAGQQTKQESASRTETVPSQKREHSHTNSTICLVMLCITTTLESMTFLRLQPCPFFIFVLSDRDVPFLIERKDNLLRKVAVTGEAILIWGSSNTHWRTSLLKEGTAAISRIQWQLFPLITRKDGSHYVIVSVVSFSARYSLTSLNKNSSLLIKADFQPWETFESLQEFIA